MTSIVGTWALVRATATAADGTPMPPPYAWPTGMGRVTFGADGRMMSVLCEGRPMIPEGAAREYNSYCGTYTFDGKTLRTKVDASAAATPVGSEQIRDVRFEGPLMVLRPPTRTIGGKVVQRELYWEKIATV